MSIIDQACAAIGVNIFDDYYDDGFVPAGEVQETYAYVDGDALRPDEQREVLLKVLQAIEDLRNPSSTLACSLMWHDSALAYPSLVGTEHERFLFKRWQLQLKNLPHREREALVEALGGRPPNYNDRPIVVYSES